MKYLVTLLKVFVVQEGRKDVVNRGNLRNVFLFL